MTAISNIRPPQLFERYQLPTTTMETGSALGRVTPTATLSTTSVASTQLLSSTTMSELLSAQASDSAQQTRAQQFMEQLSPQNGIAAIDSETLLTQKDWDMKTLAALQRGAGRQQEGVGRLDEVIKSIDLNLSKNPDNPLLVKARENLTRLIEEQQVAADAHAKKISDIVSKYQE